MNKVTQAQVDQLVADAEVSYTVLPDGKTTICLVSFWGGFFSETGHSACADPANFDKAEGEKWSLADAKEKLWKVLGTVLAYKLFTEGATWDQRLIKELEREKADLEKAQAFTKTQLFKDQEPSYQNLFMQQVKAMGDKVWFLGKRVSLLPDVQITRVGMSKVAGGKWKAVQEPKEEDYQVVDKEAKAAGLRRWDESDGPVASAFVYVNGKFEAYDKVRFIARDPHNDRARCVIGEGTRKFTSYARDIFMWNSKADKSTAPAKAITQALRESVIAGMQFKPATLNDVTGGKQLYYLLSGSMTPCMYGGQVRKRLEDHNYEVKVSSEKGGHFVLALEHLSVAK